MYSQNKYSIMLKYIAVVEIFLLVMNKNTLMILCILGSSNFWYPHLTFTIQLRIQVYVRQTYRITKSSRTFTILNSKRKYFLQLHRKNF